MKKKLLPIVLVCVLVVLLVGCEAQAMARGEPPEQATWTMILALVAPLLIGMFKQTGLSKKQNSLIALGLCLAVGIGDAIYFGQVDPTDIAQTVFNVITATFAAYKMIWQPFGFDDWWTEKTSFIKQPHRGRYPPVSKSAH